MVRTSRFFFLLIVTSLASTASAGAFRLADGGSSLYGHQSALGRTLQYAFAGEQPTGLFADITGGGSSFHSRFYSATRVGARFDLGYGSEKNDEGFRYWTSLGISQESISEAMNNPELYYKNSDDIRHYLMVDYNQTTALRGVFGCSGENKEGVEASYEITLDVPFDTYSTLVVSNFFSASVPMTPRCTLESSLGAAYAARGVSTLMGRHYKHLPSWLSDHINCIAGMLSPVSKVSRSGLYASFTLGAWYRKNGFFGGLGIHGMTVTSSSHPLFIPIVRQVNTNQADKEVRFSVDPARVQKMEDFGSFACVGYQGSFFKIMFQVTSHDASITQEPVASLTGSFTF